MDRRITSVDALLGVVALFCLLIVPITAATASGSDEPTARASASVKKKLKKLRKQVAELQLQVDGLETQPGPQGPQGETGPAGSPDTGTDILGKLAPVDGTASGLDVDQLDGHNTPFFQQRGTTTACTGSTKATQIEADGDLVCAGDLGAPASRLETADTTPEVAGVTELQLSYPSPTAITDLTGALDGQVVTLLAENNQATSITDADPFILAGNWTSNTGDTLTLMRRPGSFNTWFEVARSDNSP